MQANYNYAYDEENVDEGRYEYNEETQDICAAGYQGIGENKNEYNDMDDPDEDPYAGIDIDYTTLKKPTVKETKKTKGTELKKNSSKRTKGKSSVNDSSKDKSELDSNSKYKESDEYDSDIDKARVEDASHHNENSEIIDSGEKIMESKDLKRLQDKSKNNESKSDALSLADKESEYERNSKIEETKKEENKMIESNTFTNSSKFEERAMSKIVKAADKKIDSKKEEVKKTMVEVSGDTYSYDEDFEQSTSNKSKDDEKKIIEDKETDRKSVV